MKRKLASFLFALSVVGFMTSCEEMNYGEGQLPPLAGEVVFTDVTGTSAARVSPNFVLGVELSNGSGAALEAVFSCSAPVLQAGTYTEASAGYATAGNFITGADGTTLTINGEKHLVTAGTIKVAENGGTYTFDGIVKLGNGENYSFKWTGSGLAWTGLPELKKLSVVTLSQVNQNKTITLNLSDGKWTETVEYDANWQPTYTYTGAGNYLSVDFYSEDGYLAAGTYAPSVNPEAPAKGEYATGYEFDGSAWGMGIMQFGTNWWTVDANAATPKTAEAITKGNITVSIDEKNVYTITVDNGELYVQFTGEIPAVTKPAVPADPWAIEGDIVIQKSEGLMFTQTDDTANNTQADGSTALSGVTLWFVEVKDEAGNNAAILDLVVKEGQQSLVGEYKVTSYPDEPGEAGNGFDLNFPEWGLVMSGGTIVYGEDGTAYVIDADKSQVKVTEEKGQTIIIIKGTTTDQTTYQTKTIAAKYVIGEPKEDEGGEGEGGACGCDCDGCKDCTGGSGDGDDEGGNSFNGERLTTFLSLTPNTGIVSAQLGTAGLSVVQSDWGAQISGEGNYLKFDAYSADGTLAAGVYRASAVGGVVGEGEFSIGYDTTMDFGFGPMEFTNWGTCWMTRNADGSETGVKITDGTLTVEISGETYTITLESSVLNAQYVGPLK